MMPTRYADAQQFQADARRQSRLALGRAVSLYLPTLRSLVHSATPPDRIEPFVTIFSNAIDSAVDVEAPDFVGYAEALVEILVAVGGPAVYPDRGRILELVTRTAPRLVRIGRGTTGLRLAAARLAAAISNGGRQRLDHIHAAIDESRDGPERFRATLVLAQFYIDTSRYRSAHRALDLCEGLAVNNIGYTAHLLATRGLVYFYSDHGRAMRKFEEAIRLGSTADQIDATRAISTALHFIGLIHYVRREYQVALTFLETAQLARADLPAERKARGFHELRMAEILIDANDIASGQWHVAQAASSFHLVHETSTAEATLNSVLARIAKLQGRTGQAGQLLTIAVEVARRDRYPRGELVFLVALLGLHLQRRRIGAAIAIALRVVWLYVGTQPLSGARYFAYRIAREVRRGADTDADTRCPCRHHAGPGIEAELRAALRADDPIRHIREIALRR